MALAAGTAGAQQAHTDDVPPPQDTPYVGTVTLRVDASDTAQGIFRVHETIPVKAGALTLLYPQWIPGDHSPTGPIAMLAGLKLSANGKPLMWKRDKYNVYAFHVEVPAGVSSLDASFQYLSGRTDDEGFEITDLMMDMEWSKVALYPAGYYSRGISFVPQEGQTSGIFHSGERSWSGSSIRSITCGMTSPARWTATALSAERVRPYSSATSARAQTGT